MTDRPTRHRIPPRMTQRSRSLRRGSTYPERILWSVLRNKQLKGLQFRRQHAVGRYVVDFYCPGAKLVVEVDGESHTGRAQQDAKRSAYLEGRGLTVLRLANDDVMGDLEAVAKAILDAAGVDTTAGKAPPSPAPPPEREGGMAGASRDSAHHAIRARPRAGTPRLADSYDWIVKRRLVTLAIFLILGG